MKKFIRNVATVFSFIIVSVGFSFSAHAASATYIFDPNHTTVSWHANHFGFSNPSGKWQAEGSLVFDRDNPKDSKVNVMVQVAEISTGVKELDKHLKEKLFFDVEKFPTAIFVSDKVTMTGNNTAKVEGVLTFHGVSKPIVLNVKLNKEGINPINNKQTVGFTATTQFNRSGFDMNSLLPGISDEVKIDIEAEATLDKNV
ncbi:MAG: polyisoprenoid-binding protein [Proteobacteria bacterium]|nr:polyisoprenoid-binding protein [Pseudomonadota bacterium]